MDMVAGKVKMTQQSVNISNEPDRHARPPDPPHRPRRHRALRRQAGPARHFDRHPRSRRHLLHRTLGLRQVDLPALHQPHERHHRRRQGRRHDQARRRGHLRSHARRGRTARPHRHGVPEAQSLPQVDLRKRRLWPQDPWPRPHQDRPRRNRRLLAPQGRPLRRGQGSPQRARHRPLRWPAAAPLHCPRHRRRPRSHPDGRALLGARSDRHRHHRRADRRTARELHHRHRHPLDAAGRPRVARRRPSSTWAI